MKRTTIALDKDLLQRLKARAAGEGTTMSRLVNGLLRLVMKPGRRARYRFKPVLGKGRPRPGVVLTDRDALFDLMEER